MLPGMEMLACPNLAVSPQVMQHIVQVESGANPYAIGVVGGRLARQPRNIDEALATARTLESKGYDFSVGIAQVNRANLGRYGLDSYRKAFNACDNLAAGAQILAGCYDSAHGDWGKAFSCYYSGNFVTGFRDGYVQKVYASINRDAEAERASTPLRSNVPAVPLTDSNAIATTAASAKGTLRPVVVYSSDSAGYRVALRSVAMNAVAAAIAPMVVSASRSKPRSEALASANAAAPLPNPTTVRLGASHGQQPGNAQLPISEALTQRSNIPSVARSAASDVVAPQVRGPNDPPEPLATTGRGTTAPRADSADLRQEHRDVAFVF